MSESEDDVIEIPFQKTISASKLTDEEVSRLKITCTVCGDTIGHRFLNRIRAHIHLRVLTCQKCHEFYDDGNFSRDETGDKYCRWCADGGRLMACDNCTNAFCVKCIANNMGKDELAAIKSNDKWTCYCCDPTPLLPHVKFCQRILKYKMSKSKDISESSDSEEWKTQTWGGPLLEQAEKAGAVLNLKLSKIKHKLSRNAGSAQVFKYVSKLKRVLSKHNKFMEYLLVDIKDKLEENSTGDGGVNICDNVGDEVNLDDTVLMKDSCDNGTSEMEVTLLDDENPQNEGNVDKRVSFPSEPVSEVDPMSDLNQELANFDRLCKDNIAKPEKSTSREKHTEQKCDTSDTEPTLVKPSITLDLLNETEPEIILPDFDDNDSVVEENTGIIAQMEVPEDLGDTLRNCEATSVNGGSLDDSSKITKTKEIVIKNNASRKGRLKRKKGKVTKVEENETVSPAGNDNSLHNSSSLPVPNDKRNGECDNHLVLEASSNESDGVRDIIGSDGGDIDGDVESDDVKTVNKKEVRVKKGPVRESGKKVTDQVERNTSDAEEKNSDVENEKARMSLLDKSFFSSPETAKKGKSSSTSNSSDSEDSTVAIKAENKDSA